MKKGTEVLTRSPLENNDLRFEAIGMTYEELTEAGFRIEATGMTFNTASLLIQALRKEGVLMADYGLQCVICHTSVDEVQRIASENNIRCNVKARKIRHFDLED